jgi:hypothetical protein
VSTQQIAPEVKIPDDISPRLKRKLEKHLAAKEKKRGGKRINAGQKPKWAKHLSRNTAALVLKQVDLRERVIELIATSDERLRFEVLRYLWDRLEGKPFVAENPNAGKPASALHQDNRLQLAIQNLVVSPPAKKQRKVKGANVIQAQLSEGQPSTAETHDTPAPPDAPENQ